MSGIDRINGVVDRAIAVINGVGGFLDRVCEVGSYLCAEGKRITSQEGESKVVKGFQIVGLVFQGIVAILSCVTCSEISKKMATANQKNCSIRDLDVRQSAEGKKEYFKRGENMVDRSVGPDVNNSINRAEEI